MPASNRTMIHRLQNAINSKGGKILYEKTQFFSNDQKRPVSIYRLSQSLETKDSRHKKEKLFESTSMIQLVLYLRDLWFYINGWEIPEDNETWNAVKKTKHIDYSLVIIGDTDG